MTAATGQLVGLRAPWRRHAACITVDPDAFFPPQGGGYNDVRRICDACPVANECAASALLEEERYDGGRNRYGMRGGYTPDERHAIAGTGRLNRLNRRHVRNRLAASGRLFDVLHLVATHREEGAE